MAWKVYCLFHLVVSSLIYYVHCYNTIQMNVEFNSMDQIHAFYRSTRWRIQDTFKICVGALFHRLRNGPLRCD